MAEILQPANHIYPDPDFITDGVLELPAFLREKENYTKLVEWYCARWDNLDKEVVKLAYLRLLENASGKILDDLGERIGLERHNQSDVEYKALIKLRSFRQTVGDSRKDIVTLLKILFFGETPFITKGSNNFIEVIIPENCLADEDVANQLEDMFPINVNLWVTQTDADPFYLIDEKTGIQPTGTGGLSDDKESTVESLLTNWIHSSARAVKIT